jgi:hypothetical protein
VEGTWREVESAWRLVPGGGDAREVGFQVAAYDRSRPLVIDPVLVYSTYLGGSQEDEGTAIAADPQGNAYVTGFTQSPDFPLSGGALKPFLESFDAFVTKIAPDGSLVYSTYLGSSQADSGSGIAVDAAGYAYVAGNTQDVGGGTQPTDFPLVNPLPQQQRGSDGWNAFVAKLDPTGSSLVYSTLLGGSSFDALEAIAVDRQGHAYVTGLTGSRDFPTVNAFQGSATTDTAFVSKLSPSGSALVYSTFLGNGPWARSIAVDSAGHAHVAGTVRGGLPIVGAIQPAPGGGQDAFVSKLAPSGSSLIYSTYLGGSGNEFDADVAAGPSGNAYVAGYTDSDDFPVRGALQPVMQGFTDVFATRLAGNGALVYSTYLGGSYLDTATGIAVDAAGSAHVVGFTSSADFPLKAPLRNGCGSGCLDAFVSRLSSDGASLVFSTYLGGSGGDYGRAIALDPRGSTYVTGVTDSPDLATDNAFQHDNHGRFDAFVMKLLAPSQPPACTAATASPAVIWPPNGKLVPVRIGGVTDPDGDPVEISVTSIRQDEPLSKKGQPDATGIGTSRPMLRASRAGNGDGRVYHITFTATDSAGASCSGTVTVCVPHDQGKRACGDGGPLFSSIR